MISPLLERLRAEIAEIPRREECDSNGEYMTTVARDGYAIVADALAAIDAAMPELAALAEAAQEIPTICRDCRKNDADFIFWGKLYPPEVLGPKCYDCASIILPTARLSEHTLRQSAVIDLRPIRKALAPFVEPRTSTIQ